VNYKTTCDTYLTMAHHVINNVFLQLYRKYKILPWSSIFWKHHIRGLFKKYRTFVWQKYNYLFDCL